MCTGQRVSISPPSNKCLRPSSISSRVIGYGASSYSEGRWLRPSQYSEEPYAITRALIEDGRKHLVLGGLIETGCPVRILQGVQDPDVPWQHAMELSSRLARDDVVLTLVKDGDHRLSRPEDIERLTAAIAEF